MNNIVPQDFNPINTWIPDTKHSWSNGKAMYLIDASTDRRYWNESKGVVGFKCFLLTLGTPIVHSIATIANLAYRILKLVTFANFWINFEIDGSYDLKSRKAEWLKDLLRVVSTPVVLAALELITIYGYFRPYDGRKLYATVERAYYGNFILAPCFQPDPKFHAFGGDPNKRNAF